MGKSIGAAIYEMLKKNRTKSGIMTILKLKSRLQTIGQKNRQWMDSKQNKRASFPKIKNSNVLYSHDDKLGRR